MHWIAFKEDVAAALKAAVKPKTIVVHPMTIDLVVSIDDKAQKEIAKDQPFMLKLRKQCQQATDKAVHEMEAALKKADGQARGFPEDMIGLFLRPVHVALEHSFDEACKKIGHDAAKLLDDYRKANDGMKKISIKVDIDTKFEGIEIPGKKRPTAGAIKLAPIETGATLGDAQKEMTAFIASIARLGNLGLGIQRTLDQIVNEKAPQSKAPAANAPPEDTKDASKESGRVIALRQAEVVKIQKEWTRISATFKSAETEHDAWQKKFNTDKSKLPPEKAKRIAENMKKAEAAIDGVLKATVRVSSALKALEPAEAKFKAAQDAALEGKPGWVKELHAARSPDELLLNAARELAKVVQERLRAAADAEKAIAKLTKP